jgi:glycosyltransferase involved in cell wall biosynthesis
VAQRLNSALNQYTTVSSQHLIFEASRSDLSETQVWANTPLRKWRALVNHALDKFDFLQYERDRSIRFQFNHARVGVDISEHPLILDADIIHIHWIFKGFLSFDSLKKLLNLGKPVVWTCHDLWPFTGGCFHPRNCNRLTVGCGDCPYLFNSEQYDSSFFWFKQKLDLFKTNMPVFVFPSKWVFDQVMNGIIFKETTLAKVISNPIKVNKLSRPNGCEKDLLKAKLGLKSEGLTLLFSAANVNNPSKGFKEFIQIVELISHLPIQVLITGLVKSKFEFTVPFVYTGYLKDANDIANCFSASDLYITTSKEETFGMTIAESMSHGLPVFGYDVGAIPELICNNENGYIFREGDVLGIASKIEELMKNSNDLERLSNGARLFAENNCDEAIVAKSYAALYNHVMT